MEAAGREPFGCLVPPPPSAPHQVELRLRQTTYWDVTTSRLPLTRSRPACGRAAPWDTEQMKGLLLQITQDSDGQTRPTVSPVNGSMVIFETDQGRNFVRVVSPAVPNDEGQAEAGGEVAASPTTGSRMLSCLPAFSSCLPSPPACVPRCVPAVAAKLSTALIYDFFAGQLKKNSTTPQTFYEAPPSARAARCNLDLGQISASRSA